MATKLPHLLQGVQGIPGNQGERGYTGRPGEEGERGMKGEMGEKGDVGPRGFDGQQVIGCCFEYGSKGTGCSNLALAELQGEVISCGDNKLIYSASLASGYTLNKNISSCLY